MSFTFLRPSCGRLRERTFCVYFGTWKWPSNLVQKVDGVVSEMFHGQSNLSSFNIVLRHLSYRILLPHWHSLQLQQMYTMIQSQCRYYANPNLLYSKTLRYGSIRRHRVAKHKSSHIQEVSTKCPGGVLRPKAGGFIHPVTNSMLTVKVKGWSHFLHDYLRCNFTHISSSAWCPRIFTASRRHWPLLILTLLCCESG